MILLLRQANIIDTIALHFSKFHHHNILPPSFQTSNLQTYIYSFLLCFLHASLYSSADYSYQICSNTVIYAACLHKNNEARQSQHVSICVHRNPSQLLDKPNLLARGPSSAFCPPVVSCDVTFNYKAHTAEYTRRLLSFGSPINTLACTCPPALSKQC